MTEQHIMAEIVEQLTEKPPTRPLDHYAVVAWWRGGWWKLFADLHTERQHAIDAAECLPDGWMHRTVVAIRRGDDGDQPNKGDRDGEQL